MDDIHVTEEMKKKIDNIKIKLNRLYGVKVYFEAMTAHFLVEQRVYRVVLREQDNPTGVENAKEYIRGVCDPERSKRVSCSFAYDDADFRENIEQTSNAIIRKSTSTPNDIKISGSRRAVEAAMKALIPFLSESVNTGKKPEGVLMQAKKSSGVEYPSASALFLNQGPQMMTSAKTGSGVSIACSQPRRCFDVKDKPENNRQFKPEELGLTPSEMLTNEKKQAELAKAFEDQQSKPSGVRQPQQQKRFQIDQGRAFSVSPTLGFDLTEQRLPFVQENPSPSVKPLLPPKPKIETKRVRRYIVIDGNNVAYTHGRDNFSSRGIEIVVDYFLSRCHKVTVFVPQSRQNLIQKDITRDHPALDHIAFTPSRIVPGRYILELTDKEDGVIVSNSQFRDLSSEKESWKFLIEQRLLNFVFVGDHFMPPDDPLGRSGPHLEEFLTMPSRV